MALYSLLQEEDAAMMIFILAAAMTTTMLIATAVALHYEAQCVRLDDRHDRMTRFGRS